MFRKRTSLRQRSTVRVLAFLAGPLALVLALLTFLVLRLGSSDTVAVLGAALGVGALVLAAVAAVAATLAYAETIRAPYLTSHTDSELFNGEPSIPLLASAPDMLVVPNQPKDARWWVNHAVRMDATLTNSGTDFAVHGASRQRATPALRFSWFCITSADVPTATVDVVCDGFDAGSLERHVLFGLKLPLGSGRHDDGPAT